MTDLTTPITFPLCPRPFKYGRTKTMTTFSPTPKTCDICKHEFEKTLGTPMYDSIILGHWGCFCHVCFEYFRCSLGDGKGQRYERQADETFLLTDGGR